MPWRSSDGNGSGRTTPRGIVAYPGHSAIVLMQRHIGPTRRTEIPTGTSDVPRDYFNRKRASWIIEVKCGRAFRAPAVHDLASHRFLTGVARQPPTPR